jgi:hypothetical protein
VRIPFDESVKDLTKLDIKSITPFVEVVPANILVTASGLDETALSSFVESRERVPSDVVDIPREYNVE